MRVLQVLPIIVTSLLVQGAAVAGDGNGSGRLKYKDGPVCMCNNGLSEQDIRAAGSVHDQGSRWGDLKRIEQKQSSQKVERRRDEKE